MISLARLMGLSALSFSIGYTQVPGPIGLITDAAGTTIIRAGFQDVGVPAYAGDLIFDGDTLLPAAGGRVVLAFCPTSNSYAASAGRIQVTQAGVYLDGKTAMSPLAHLQFCRLPVVSPDTPRDLRTVADRIQVSGRTPAAPPQLTTEQRASLDPYNAALQRNPADLTALLARAIAHEALGDNDAAAADYDAIVKLAPQAHWAEDESRAVLAQRERVAQGIGKVIGVVIGISDYANLGAHEQLQYADKDAEYFYSYLVRPRGGARPANVTLLVNSQAKIGDIKTAIASAFAQAKRDDSVVIFIAAHGIPTADGQNRGAYIMAYNSSKEDLEGTALRMEDLQELTEKGSRPQRIQMIVDACYSGLIGEIDRRRFNIFAADFFDKDRPVNQVLGLMASGRTEPSYECSNFDHGHGAFTYFLVHGLNANEGEAVDQARGQITVYSLFKYVQRHVEDATKDQQKPQSPEKKGNAGDRVALARTDLEGLQLPDASALPGACDSARGRTLPPEPQSALVDPFSVALQQNKILPGVPGGAFELLSQLQRTSAPEKYADARNRLLAALIDAGQAVILQYLRGEQVHMTRDDFVRGEQFFTAASQLLSGGDSFIEARRQFCQGRRLIFERNLQQAIATLREAIRLDQFGAYSYNALGIAFLENAEFKPAISAFQNAVRLAPYWAYARHNLALAYSQEGQYNPAIATYRDAMRLGPEYLYIPFNFGLLLQRLNRAPEARALWEEILKSSPAMARAQNAIGLSYYLERRFKKAEITYRSALAIADDQTDRLAVRHDLALLLAEKKDASAYPEALALWRSNLQEKPDDLPSLVGLSDTLRRHGESAPALCTLVALLRYKPGYAGARLQYAKLLANGGMLAEAATQLDEVVREAPASAEALELLADLLSNGSARRTANPKAVRELYQRALGNPDSPAQRHRLRSKLKALARH